MTVNLSGNKPIVLGECAKKIFTDHHSGYYKIESPDTVTIEENKQMTNWNRLEIDGTLIIDGELILK